ncbi:septal ring factor EnvC (AmiA/AmiB activator) [Winogradskyella wandonensis]|uniref:Septal ring factor EnvC (AmiA/AmiB activator) n=1 Tax=Winogradskyella wandonensis TaxID=1442586 RepID=A0A4V2PTT2_9FLAO|nr:peptidoglycan DD-metalloendopeptidase family protein [Winogradskyella wandonensis]TCK67761.1 septal ring factor EnvC (AmiA/AmiB activator) [Winogradskyella wandonensis]
MRFKSIFILVLVSVFSLSVVNAQSNKQKELEAKRQRILREINQLNSLNRQVKKKEVSVLKQVEDVDLKIRIRQNLINVTNEQANQLTRDINNNQKQITELRDQLELLKDNYAKMIVKSYKSKSEQSKVMFLLSSDNFKQAYKRLQYINQYKAYQKKQAEDIKLKTQELQKLNLKLSEQREQKKKLVAENQKAKRELEKEMKAQKELMALIRKDLKTYTAQIRKKRQEADRIDREINRLIREAIAASNKKAGKTSSSGEFALTPAGKALAENFEANKGRLRWPVDRGVIKSRYGVQRSITDKTVKNNYRSIYITTEENASVKAVFTGEVYKIMIIKNANPAVMIRHGNYITVYMNMSKINVKPGEKVETGQVIGKAFTNKTTGETLLGFRVYKNDATQNPEYWLSKN